MQAGNRSAVLSGVLEAYYEQGMEGLILFAFRPNVPSASHLVPVLLGNGDYLKIFDERGRVLWEGELAFVPRRSWWETEKHHLSSGVWSDGMQKGCSYHDRISWFWRKSPLRAEWRTADWMTQDV